MKILNIILVTVISICSFYSCKKQTPSEVEKTNPIENITFMKIYSRGIGNSVVQASDGGYVFNGNTGAGTTIIKTDQYGVKQWEKSFAGGIGNFMCKSNDGGYMITGFSIVNGGDVYVLKIDSIGNKLWEQNYGGSLGDVGNCIEQTSDNNYIIIGYTRSFDSQNSDFYFIKVDVNGKIVWEKNFGGNSYNYGHFVQETNDGQYIIVGETGPFGSVNSEIHLIKIDKNGNIVWEKLFGDEYSDISRSVKQTKDNGFILSGAILSRKGFTDVVLIKTDAMGNLQWQKIYGGNLYDQGNSVQQTLDEGFILTGFSTIGIYGQLYLLRVGQIGNIIWEKTFGTGSGNSVYQTKDSGYVITGYSGATELGQQYITLLKTDKNGDILK